MRLHLDKLMLEAIRALPADYVGDDTHLMQSGPSVVVAHPALPPMVYTPDSCGYWKVVRPIEWDRDFKVTL